MMWLTSGGQSVRGHGETESIPRLKGKQACESRGPPTRGWVLRSRVSGWPPRAEPRPRAVGVEAEQGVWPRPGKGGQSPSSIISCVTRFPVCRWQESFP